MVDINDPRNYKPCQKKQYDIHVCMPEKGTIVINRLEQAPAARQSRGTWATAEQLNRGEKDAFKIFAGYGEAYVVSDKTPFVLCGTVGELWCIDPQRLAQTYTFLQNGAPCPINQQTLNDRLKDGYLDWTVVRTAPASVAGKLMACFVPVKQAARITTSWGAELSVNMLGISHGLGDFIVCPMQPNGHPNMADRWVVNGEVFACTYNNRGWTHCLDQRANITNKHVELPPLIPAITANTSAFEYARRKLSGVDGVHAHKFPDGFDGRKDTDPSIESAFQFLIQNGAVLYRFDSAYIGLVIEPSGRGFVFETRNVASPNGSVIYRQDLRKFTKDEVQAVIDRAKRRS